METQEIEFLQQSNYIEGIRGDLDQTVKAWQFIKKQDWITQDLLLKTHKLLMKNQSIDKKFKGAYRTVSVWVGEREGIHYSLIKEAMEAWILNANCNKEMWKENHVRFEKIHPFIDGNGRMGRILLNWERIKINLPILVIREEDRFEYYKWFKDEEFSQKYS